MRDTWHKAESDANSKSSVEKAESEADDLLNSPVGGGETKDDSVGDDNHDDHGHDHDHDDNSDGDDDDGHHDHMIIMIIMIKVMVLMMAMMMMVLMLMRILMLIEIVPHRLPWRATGAGVVTSAQGTAEHGDDGGGAAAAALCSMSRRCLGSCA